MQNKRSCVVAVAGLLLATLGGLPTPALAGTFEVKTPDINKGDTSFSWNNNVQGRFPVNADPTRYSSEIDLGYSPTSWFFIGGKINFDQAVDEHWKVSTAGAEMQLRFEKARPGFDYGWYTGVDVRINPDETNTLTFGPIIQFGDDKLSLTLNPFFQKTFGENREDGIAFAYGVMAKREIKQGMAFGIEAYGTIPDIGHGTPIAFQDHRIGPVLYFEREVGSPHHKGGSQPKATLDIGTYFGLTDASPDVTGKVKVGLTW
jgi:hypothetical protein